MGKLCVFAGTTEGRRLVEFLAGQDLEVTACVATEYGQALLSPAENLTVSAERLTREQMTELFSREGFDLVVDATHPYAAAVTENIRGSCLETGTPYQRLLRGTSEVCPGAVYVPDISEALAFLGQTRGNILLTTGSKELARFSQLEDFAQRVYARVLPLESSLTACRETGLPASHILAMQGPFSRELNTALLRQIGAAFLVTKDGGGPGGFEAKAAAAREAGAELVVIGRPPQGEGLSCAETLKLLCRRFGLTPRPEVFLVGIGPGDKDAMTAQARHALESADCLIGAKRMLEASAVPGQAVFEAVAPGAIAEYITAHPEFSRFAVALSGDPGFFSGAKKLLPLLEGCRVQVLPGISSLSCLCARLKTSYEDAAVVSVHGRDHDIVPDVRRHRRVFVLAGGENGMGSLCRALTERGLGHVRVSAGERLSYPDEKITQGTARELAEKRFGSLCAALIENPAPDAVVTPGLPDNAFLRGGETSPVPMTKSEVRAVCLSKLRLTPQAVCWDIGAGTGSVSVEMALLCPEGRVYAIERREDALALTEENRRRFSLENLIPVSGSAPEACRELPVPTHAFIGGSSGNLRQILSLLLEKNPGIRIVATAVTLESIAELTQAMKDFPQAEAVWLSVARDRKAGAYHLMAGQNPVMIVTLSGGETA